MTSTRRLAGVGLALLSGVALGAAPAAAQIGALAVAAATAGSSGEYALAGAPVFSESGLVLDQGWSAGAFGVVTNTGTTFFDGFGGSVEGDVAQSNLSTGVFVAAGERAMVGAVLNPYVSTEFSAGGQSETFSGLGNLTLVGKLALNPDSPTRFAAGVSVVLPTGDEDIVSQAMSVTAGLGASHPVDANTSLHGGLSLTFNGEDEDRFIESSTAIGFNGAVVRQLNPKTWLSGELLGSSVEGAWQVLLAPGLRFRAGERVFIDAGLAFGALSSDDAFPIDYGLAVGATLIPAR